MTRAGSPRADIQKMLEADFGWSAFMVQFGLDGLMAELK
jgi:hypothetical protein